MLNTLIGIRYHVMRLEDFVFISQETMKLLYHFFYVSRELMNSTILSLVSRDSLCKLSYRFVLHENALQTADGEVCLLGLLVAHLQVLREGEHGGDGVLGDGRGGVGGDAANADPSLLAQLDRNIVESGERNEIYL